MKTDHRDRDRAKEHLGERLGICPHDRGGPCSGAADARQPRWHCRGTGTAPDVSAEPESSVQEVYEQRNRMLRYQRGADHRKKVTPDVATPRFERRRVRTMRTSSVWTIRCRHLGTTRYSDCSSGGVHRPSATSAGTQPPSRHPRDREDPGGPSGRPGHLVPVEAISRPDHHRQRAQT